MIRDLRHDHTWRYVRITHAGVTLLVPADLAVDRDRILDYLDRTGVGSAVIWKGSGPDSFPTSERIGGHSA